MIHKSADVSPLAKIGINVLIWNNSQVREYAAIGDNSIIAKGVYVDRSVKIGKRVKIQNNASIYHACTIEDDVFIGPGVIITNDKHPRSFNSSGEIKSDRDWVIGNVHIEEGASIGAGSIIVTGVNIGKYSMIGAGSVITKSVHPFELVFGNPAIHQGYVCKCGKRLLDSCETCNTNISLISSQTKHP